MRRLYFLNILCIIAVVVLKFNNLEQEEGMLSQIKKESEKGLVLCFVGVGSAFAKKNSQTSLIIAKERVAILVDIGTTIPTTLSSMGIGIYDFDAYHITHSHADHIGGLEELLLMSRYVIKRIPQFIITETYQDILWDKSLRGGCEYNEDGLLKFSDLAVPLRPEWVRAQPREIYRINFKGIELIIFRTAHIPGEVQKWERAFWSTGLVIDGKVIFTGDTRFDLDIFRDLERARVEAIFHDCQLFSPGTVHASYEELKTLTPPIKGMMYLTHYGDSFDQFDPQRDGFRGFAKPWEIYKF